MSDAQFLALLAAVCACIPARDGTTIDQDIALAQEYLDSARKETAPAPVAQHDPPRKRHPQCAALQDLQQVGFVAPRAGGGADTER